MCKEFNIAKRVLYTYVGSGESFSTRELADEIRRQGGVSRIGAAQDVDDTVDELARIGLVSVAGDRISRVDYALGAGHK